MSTQNGQPTRAATFIEARLLSLASTELARPIAWLQLLTAVAPGVARVDVLWDPTTGPLQRDAVHTAARTLSLEVHLFEVPEDAAWQQTFTGASRARPAVLLILASQLMRRNSKRIADFAAQSRLPAMSPFRDFPEAGGLMSYGPFLPEWYRRCGIQLGKILQGAKASDLPIERPDKFEFVLNLQTAKALRVTIPPSLLMRADHVIE